MIKRQELEEDELKTTAENELQELQQLQVGVHITFFMGPFLDSSIVLTAHSIERANLMWRKFVIKIWNAEIAMFFVSSEFEEVLRTRKHWV